MAVGSGSIKRVQKVAAEIQGDVPVVEEAAVEVKTEVKEEAAKKAPAKKPAADRTKTTAKKAAAKKKEAVKAESKKDDLHEKKFEVVSNIKSDLPYYLL